MTIIYQEIRTVIEFAAAIICIILTRFMIKPYNITGESRYLGLPIGFGFLGVTYALTAVTFFIPDIFGGNTFYIQLIARTFAFLFIAVTYYFSKKLVKNSQWIWRITLTLIISLFIIALLITSLPNFNNVSSYRTTDTWLRVINIIIILYICIQTFRSHVRKRDPKTLWIPIGYSFLAVSQYSVLLFSLVMDRDHYTLFGGLILRMIFLCIFLFVSLGVFHQAEKVER